MHTTKCPPRNRLKDYLAGKLDHEDSDVLERHLSSCDHCERAASEIDNEPDSMVELLQSNPLPTPPQREESEPDRSDDRCRLPSIPSVIASYELLRQLGRGGMGAVYLARHKSLDKQVAIKLLPALRAKTPEFVARFQREMRAAGQLEHPTIVRSTDAGEEHGIHFLVMDAIDGLDLSRIARTQDHLSITDACEIARQTALGLSYAHEKGIVHRDIKPSNLMLDTHGQVKILDFGLAQVGFWDSESAEITTVGQLMGTLDYMAPEQAERSGAVDYRADLYSLGATLFRLLAGRPPLAAAPDLTPLEKLRLLSTHRAPKLATLRAVVPAELSELTDSLLSREPSARPASAAHAAELLEPFCRGAKLEPLLARAKAIPDEPAPNHPPFAAWIHQRLPDDGTPTGSLSVSIDPSRDRNGWGRIVTWGTIPMIFCMAFAAILFALETSKGQLVIESENADVQVKLVKDGKENSELHIQPGTQTTRLRGGKYEIIIDSPSNNFAVSNQQFTIRNGQTVVAKITTKVADAAQLADSFPLSPSPPSDKRLDEVVYEGESLDVWLRRLKFERSHNKLKEALEAVNAMATENVSDLIEPALIEFLRDPNSDSDRYGLAVKALASASDERYFDNLTAVVSQVPERSRRDKLIGSFFTTATLRNAHNVDELTKFLQWASDALQEPASPDGSNRLASLLKAMLDDYGNERIFPLPCQHATLRVLRSSPLLSDREFWLAETEGVHWQEKKPWVDPLRQEIARRAVAVIIDPNTDVKFVTQAALVLNSMGEFSFELTSDQESQLVDALSKRITKAAGEPRQAIGLFAVPESVAPGVEPMLPETNWGERRKRDTVANPLIVLLNLANTFQLQTALQPSIQSLHNSFGKLDLYETHFGLIKGRKADWNTVLRFARDRSIQERFIQQIVYVQSGLLVGNEMKALVARLQRREPADIAVLVDQAMDTLEYSEDRNDKQLALSTLDRFANEEHARRANPILTQLLVDQPEWPSLGKVITLLSRVAGDQFLTQFAKSLEAGNQQNREALLHASTFYALPALRCDQPSSLTELLNWTDSIFASSAQEDVTIQPAVAKLLRTLLRDRSKLIVKQQTESVVEPGLIGESCQRTILEHLMSYSKLTDQNFWLAEPMIRADNPRIPPMDILFRQVVLDRSMAVLTQDTNLSKQDRLQAHALMVVRSVRQAGDELSEEQRLAVSDFLSDLFSSASVNLNAESNFHALYGRFDHLPEPHVPNSKTERESIANDCNTLLVGLNLVSELGLESELKGPLQSLHDAAGKPRITTNYYSGYGSWSYRLQRGQSKNAGEFFTQTVFLQTGILLGKDSDELLNQPARFKQEDDDARRRLVQPGDTLAIYIPGLLPGDNSPPPVIQAGKRSPVIGFPVPVNAEGKILVPLLPELSVKGKDPKQVREILVEAYTDKILKSSATLGISVQFLMRANEQVELRNITGQAAPPAAP